MYSRTRIEKIINKISDLENKSLETLTDKINILENENKLLQEMLKKQNNALVIEIENIKNEIKKYKQTNIKK
jgi:predicted KAP-like P-loop ATPase